MDLTDQANEPGIFTVLDVSARRAAVAHVSVGSVADLASRLRDVCSSLNSGHFVGTATDAPAAGEVAKAFEARPGVWRGGPRRRETDRPRAICGAIGVSCAIRGDDGGGAADQTGSLSRFSLADKAFSIASLAVAIATSFEREKPVVCFVWL